MKKMFFSVVILLLTTNLFSQKIINEPKTGFTTAPYLQIKKIEITDSTTVVSFEIANEAGYRFIIPKKTFIKDATTEKKLYIKSAEGLSMGKTIKMPESGVFNYKLIFEKLDQSITKLDFGEDGGHWFIYDIDLQNESNQSNKTNELAGNWYNLDTGNWEIGIYNSNAVYRNQVWSYTVSALKNEKGSITLTNKDQKITLFFNKQKEGTYSFGGNPKSLKNYSNTPTNLSKKPVTDNKPYEMPIFKSDLATYSGYIKGYTPRVNIKTIAFAVDDIISGNQNKMIAKIDENGFFSIQIPLYYPHEVWIRSDFYNGSVYLEPGKEVFQLFGDRKTQYMGNLAGLNLDLQKTKDIRRENYEDKMARILVMEPAEYKTYCKKIADQKNKKLDSLKQSNAIGAKAHQIGKLEIEYNVIGQMLSYQRDFETAYRQKNKIPSEQRELASKTDTLTADYYDFITDAIINNPIAVISTHSYSGVINKLEYSDIVYKNSKKINFTFFDIVNELKKRGYTLTKEEEQLLIDTKEVEAFQNSPEQKEFERKFKKISIAFLTKHLKIFKEITKDDNYKSSDLENYLIKNNIPISNEEKEYLAAEKELEMATPPEKTKFNQIVYKNQSAFYKKNQTLINNLFNEINAGFRNEKLSELFGIKPGFATDIMTVNRICNTVVDQLTPLSDDELMQVQKSIQTPFVAEHLKKCNQQSLAKLEENKTKTGYILNETPKTEADKLFAEIMKKYQGKVVYVDFWATWCAPCRSGIERIKPLKEEMIGKDVAFVYLTNQTSPEKTYSAMIPDIKGEHYRLSTDEWNYLAAKFNISGIPHYVLVNKKGEVVKPKLGHYDNEELKKILEEEMK